MNHQNVDAVYNLCAEIRENANPEASDVTVQPLGISQTSFLCKY